MRRDYYAVLEITATAGPREVRQAYRRLARQYSPDVNFWDTQARALFEEIAEAYRVLSDQAARAMYDRFGAAVAGDDALPAGRRGEDVHLVVELGFAEVARGTSVRLDVHGDLVLVADRYRAGDAGIIARDHVSGVNLSSLMLAALAIRRPVPSALDVGTGCGIQALLTARHSETVVATDVNPRALTFAAFNARLNGVENVELVQGSFFEPVQDRRFDLVVANPPFVISPDHDIMFRDSGLPGDTVSREILTQAPEFLNEGGLAHLLASWILKEDEPWWNPVEGWLEGRGCDAWLLLYKTEDPLASASDWAKAFHGNTEADYQRAMDRWLDYYKEIGVATIATGAVTLRRRSVPNWLRADEYPEGMPTVETDAVLRIFEAQDFLSTLPSDEELLGRALTVVDAHRLDRTLRRSQP